MRYLDHVPPALKETITIKRTGGGLYGDAETNIATGIECYIKAESGSVALNGGVPTNDFFFTVHLAEPVADAYADDIIVRSSGEELKVVRPIPIGDDIMKLIARQEGVL